MNFDWNLLKFVPRVQLTIFQHWFRISDNCLVQSCRPGDKPLSEPMMVSLPTHVYLSLSLNELTIEAHVTVVSMWWENNYHFTDFTLTSARWHLKSLLATGMYIFWCLIFF